MDHDVSDSGRIENARRCVRLWFGFGSYLYSLPWYPETELAPPALGAIVSVLFRDADGESQRIRRKVKGVSYEFTEPAAYENAPSEICIVIRLDDTDEADIGTHESEEEVASGDPRCIRRI